MSNAFLLSPLAKKSCKVCPLGDSRFVDNQVTTELHPLPGARDGFGIEVMFIAEAPGKVENSVGRPFIGGTGKILRQLVRRINGSEEGVAYGNIVRCRPALDEDPRKDRPPTPREMECCRGNIMRDIMKIKPKYIVLLGASAVTALASDRSTKEKIPPNSPVFGLRGKEFVVITPDGTEYPAVATFHFAFVSRSPGVGGVFESDVRRAFYGARGALADYTRRGNETVIIDKVDRVEKLLRHMVRNLNPHQVVALDYETSSLLRVGNKILTVGFAYDENKSFVIPYRHDDRPWSHDEFQQVRALLKRFFTTKKVSFRALIAHNLKFECAVSLDEFGVSIWNLPLDCTMLRAFALDENRKLAMKEPFALKPTSDEILGFRGYEDPDIYPVVQLRNKGRIAEAPLFNLCQYNGMDCYVEVRVFYRQEELAKQKGYREKLALLGKHLFGPVSMFAARMERNGMKLDMHHLQYLMQHDSPIVGRLFEIERKLRQIPNVQKANQMLLQRHKKGAGMRGIWQRQAEQPWIWKISKDDAKTTLFIDVLGLKTKLSKKTQKPKFDKGFWKANKGVLEVDLAQEWTELDKLRGTYIDSPYQLVKNSPEMQDGRIRGTINFHIAITGRTSSDHPNMQNIPKGKTEKALLVKKVYSVEAGNLMVCADYSQAEVRWLAQMTDDPQLKGAFDAVEKVRQAYLRNPTKENRIRMVKEGDFHRQTASQILRKPAQEVTDLERGASKQIVFGIIYGMSVEGLASALKISVQEAENYQAKFMNQFPKAKEWLSQIEQDGFKAGYVESPIGRHRHLVSGYVVTNDNEFYEINGKRFPTNVGAWRQYEDRVCRNAPIQSVASDTNLMACIQIQKFIEDNKKNWKVLNTVHDSIIAEVAWNEVGDYIEAANRIMTDPDLLAGLGIQMTIPFVADFSVGPNWAEQTNVSVAEEYGIVCLDCKADRKEEERPTNRRCENCGSKNIELELRAGALDKVLRYWKYRLKQKAVGA